MSLDVKLKPVAINFTLNAVATPSSSTEEISRGPATPAPAGRSGETTSVLLGAPGSAAPLCAQKPLVGRRHSEGPAPRMSESQALWLHLDPLTTSAGSEATTRTPE